NAFSVLLIKKDAEDNMNIRSAYLHLFSDMMTSIAVLAGGLMMKYFNWYWVDPVISIIISLYLIYLSIDILKESLKIIMEFTPGDIDLETIVTEVENIEGIKNIHHLHIWQVNEHDIMLEAHIDLKNDVSITDFEQILDKIKTGLAVHNINHVTIQPEYNIDDNKDVISH
ncbi:MAG TPA: cation transporter, partial [Bacteroidetes bacterium]|nr:cation transporter [Bacteroidota bacterium]